MSECGKAIKSCSSQRPYLSLLRLLKNQYLFLIILEAGRSKVKVLAQARSIFLVCRLPPSCCVLSMFKRERVLASPKYHHIRASRYKFWVGVGDKNI